MLHLYCTYVTFKSTLMCTTFHLCEINIINCATNVCNIEMLRTFFTWGHWFWNQIGHKAQKWKKVKKINLWFFFFFSLHDYVQTVRHRNTKKLLNSHRPIEIALLRHETSASQICSMLHWLYDDSLIFIKVNKTRIAVFSLFLLDQFHPCH